MRAAALYAVRVARILVASLPFAGHVVPTSALAAELVTRGHEVVAYTGRKYRERFAAVGASWLPWTKATDFDDADLDATFPGIGTGKGHRPRQPDPERPSQRRRLARVRARSWTGGSTGCEPRPGWSRSTRGG